MEILQTKIFQSRHFDMSLEEKYKCELDLISYNCIHPAELRKHK